MASEADHIALANKNHDVLMHLLNGVDRFPEWVTIAAFYCPGKNFCPQIFTDEHR